MRRRLFLLLAVLLAATGTASAAKHVSRTSHTNLAATPISRMDLPWWRSRHEAVLARLARGNVDLIFLGDSITQNWERRGPPEWQDIAPVWQRFYGDRHAVNMGFVGDTTASLIWRIRNGEVAGIAPKAAVVLIGANNLGKLHWSAQATLAGIDTIVADLRQRLPGTKILLIGVLPSKRSAWTDETSVAINKALATRYAHDGMVTWFDPAPVFIRDGKPDLELFYDQKMTPPRPMLHPSAAGMAKLASAIEPLLAGMLGDRGETSRR